MKKILFLLIIIMHSSSFGQVNIGGTSTYELTTKFHVERGFSACKGEGGIDRVFIVKNGYNIFTSPPKYNTSNEFTHTYEFNKNNLVSVIQFDAESTTNAIIGCKKTDFYNGKVDLENSTCSTIEGVFNMQNPRNIIYKFITTPKITLYTPTSNNSIISTDENLTITLPDNIDNQYYNWEYSVGDVTNFKRFPSQFNNVPILNLKGKDFLSDNDFGKTIYIRVNMGGCANASSNVIAFTYYKSAPHISSSAFTPNLCSYGKTGTLTFNFDRTLLAGETLEISLIDEATESSVLNKDLTNNLQSGTSHTLQNIPPGTYKLTLTGKYNGSDNTYTDSPTHYVDFEIKAPTPVVFNMASKTDAYCYQGNDGNIALSASGGQNQYQYIVTKDGQPFLDWTDFSNGNNTLIQNLSAGVYKVKVRDTNHCIAMDTNNSSIEKEITITITQPSQAIALPSADIEMVRPTGYGLSNGYISARVTGGTPKNGGSYDFEWRKDSPTGMLIPSTQIQTDSTNNPFTILLKDIAAGNYYLTVKDKNYANATSQLSNCGILSQEFIVTQPDPLVATIEIQKQISCNMANDYPYKLDLDNNGIPDEAEDGNLKAVVTGGVGAYSYQWQILTGGTFQDIPGATQSVLSNRSVGTYKVLVHDASLIPNTTDAAYTFAYPPQLTITMSANTISCHNQNTGIVSVNATGGTGTLSYQWNTLDTTPTVKGLPAGKYFVLVTDSKNCKTEGSVEVTRPDQIAITDVLVQNPICPGASNGQIKISISGGKAPYSISWSNGKTTADNIGIPAGNYIMTVTDAIGCSLTKQYTLNDPVQLIVDLGVDVTLCLGDTQTYNVAINDPLATYQWKDQNGNIIGTSSSITLSAAGTYSVLITDSKGCTATDSVKIKNSSEVLNPQFMLATHAYSEATVVLVNTSPTKPQAVEWVIPNDNNIRVVNKTDDYLELKFLATGPYEIGLKGIQGECVKTFYKKVIVEENTSGVTINSTKASNINKFMVVPNPNDGVFNVLVGLEKENPIKIRIIDMVSHEVFPAVTQTKSTDFVVPFGTALPAGSYLVILETGDEVMVKRIIVR